MKFYEIYNICTIYYKVVNGKCYFSISFCSFLDEWKSHIGKMVAREKWGENKILVLDLNYSPKNEQKLIALCLLQVVIKHEQPHYFSSILLAHAYELGFDL